MKRELAIGSIVCLLLCVSLAAAWPSAPDTNLVICDRTGSQTLPKIACTSDGGCYVSWFDNGSGNYDVYMQRLDPQGNPVWPHNGMLISNHTQGSSLVDWDLAVDSTNSAIVAFTDMRNGNLDVFVYRMSPTGQFLWGPDGIGLSAAGNTDYEANPRVCITSAGNVVIAWQWSTNPQHSVKIRKLSLDGVDLWTPATLTWAGGTYGSDFPHVVAAEADAFILADVLRQGTQIFSPRHIYMQKFSAHGDTLWSSTGVPVYVGGGVGFVTQPFLLADSLGGAYCVFYQGGSTTQHAFAQHVLANGTVAWAVNGVQTDMNAARIQTTPTASRVLGSQDLIVFCLEADLNQANFSIGYQRISAAGTRLWTDNGIMYAPLDSRQELNLSSFALADGAVAVFAQYLSGSAVNSDVEAVRVDGNGASVWATTPVIMCSVASVKQRMTAAVNVFGQLLATWPDGRIDPSWDIYLQNVNPDGSLGNLPSIAAPQNMTAIADGSNIILRWQSVEGATSYNVYASTDPNNLVNVGTVTDTTVNIVDEVNSFERRYYSVTAVR